MTHIGHRPSSPIQVCCELTSVSVKNTRTQELLMGRLSNQSSGHLFFLVVVLESTFHSHWLPPINVIEIKVQDGPPVKSKISQLKLKLWIRLNWNHQETRTISFFFLLFKSSSMLQPPAGDRHPLPKIAPRPSDAPGSR